MYSCGMGTSKGIERRRGARIKGELWVGVGDKKPPVEKCRGDISISGVYLDVGKSMGDVGHVLNLYLETGDKSTSLNIMSRVVRVVTCEDLWQGKTVAGVALEFLAQNDQQQNEVVQFVRSVAELQKRKALDLQVDCHVPARVGHNEEDSQDATVNLLRPDGMVLETDLPITAGETIRIEIGGLTSEKRMQFSGQAVKTSLSEAEQDQSRYRVEVVFNSDQQPSDANLSEFAVGSSIDDAIDSLMSEVVVWCGEAQKPKQTHLQGALSEVRLTSLLAFFDMERLSGELRLSFDEHQATIFLDQGRVIDAESSTHSSSPIDTIEELLDWAKAEFEFRFGTVQREDVIGMPTPGLLMELAHREDEKMRP